MARKIRISNAGSNSLQKLATFQTIAFSKSQANRDAGIREAECEKAAMDVKYNTDTKIEDNSRSEVPHKIIVLDSNVDLFFLFHSGRSSSRRPTSTRRSTLP